MRMRPIVLKHLKESFSRHEGLAELLSDDALGSKLPTRSNTLGGQFWCLIGARESYTKAIIENGWAGFGCSLSGEDAVRITAVIEALEHSAKDFSEGVRDLEWTEEREELLLTLLEHETQHQGQLIRYVYGLNLSIPESWAARWALSP